MNEFDSDENENYLNLFQLSDNMFQFVENVLSLKQFKQIQRMYV